MISDSSLHPLLHCCWYCSSYRYWALLSRRRRRPSKATKTHRMDFIVHGSAKRTFLGGTLLYVPDKFSHLSRYAECDKAKPPSCSRNPPTLELQHSSSLRGRVGEGDCARVANSQCVLVTSIHARKSSTAIMCRWHLLTVDCCICNTLCKYWRSPIYMMLCTDRSQQRIRGQVDKQFPSLALPPNICYCCTFAPPCSPSACPLTRGDFYF